MAEKGTNEYWIEVLKEKRIKINEISPSFCSAKWLQTTLMLQNGYNHSCHHPSPHKIPLEEIAVNPAALHNSRYKKEQRNKMLCGERPKECDYCWKIEDLDKEYFSDRHYKTADWWSWDKVDVIAKSDPYEDVYPTYLEVSFSNACNFACAYCSPEISSTWMRDVEKSGNYPVEFGSHDLNYLKSIGKFPYRHNESNPYVDAFWEWFPDAFKHLKVFRITGGEPTMSKDFWRVVDYIIEHHSENPDIQIGINSNLGTDQRLIVKLIASICKLEEAGIQVEIFTSAESIGEKAEYARDGLQYDVWIDNIKKVLSSTNARVIIMTTVNILSISTLQQFIDDIMQLRIEFNKDLAHNRIPLSVNYLRYPPHLQCTLLTPVYRETLANKLELFCEGWLKYHSPDKFARLYLEEFDQVKRLCDYLRSEPVAHKYREDFVKFIRDYDRRRGKNFEETFPELIKDMDKWNEKRI